MAHPIWQTPGGSLGLIPENEFYRLQLNAHDPAGGNVTYKFLAGKFPPGIYVTADGNLQGVPILTNVANLNRGYTFTIRASDSTTPTPLVSDNTFKLTISNIVPPQIEPRVTNLGDVFDGTYFNPNPPSIGLQLKAVEVNPNATLTWSLVGGSLPPGLTLSSSGLISGFVTPLPQVGNAGVVGFEKSPFNEFGYDAAARYQSNSYHFTVQVFDGINFDVLSYKLYVVAKDTWTSDTNIDTIDSTLTVDEDNLYLPIITTPPEALSVTPIRSNSNFAFKFDAIDPNNNALTYEIVSSLSSGFDSANFDSLGFDQSSLALPTGLAIDPNTGWLTGTLGSQAAATQTYTFEVAAYETQNPSYISVPVQYTLTVLGNINNTITWTTTSNLGSIDNGAISELSISAKSNANKTLTYSLDGQSRLPQGLSLLSSGLIVGRTSFEYFSLDLGNTTIDGGTLTFDNTYTFTAVASTTDGTATSTQMFTVLVNNFNKTPYENLYLKALPTIDQRQTFLNIVNNTEIFPENLIYRSTDPWFGRARDIRSLFISGLNPSTIDEYYATIQTNTYNKRIEFSDVKTARALDANFNVKYEVVYIELKDSAVSVNPITKVSSSPANYKYDQYISANVYLNSFDNMTSVVGSALGYENQVSIPAWMSSPQTNHKQLGFTRAIVLAYTIPGASALIAYRLKANGIVFNSIDFVADRYNLDNSLSRNYNISTKRFTSGEETTFDRITRAEIVTTSVSYGVKGLPFDLINNATVAQIQALGGLDGVLNFNTGDTLIFMQQENFVIEPSYNNNGWNLVTPSGTTVIPGYLEHSLNSTVANQRAGVWQINISPTNVVTLSFVRSIDTGQFVQVNYGISQNNTIVYYSTSLQPGNTVPAYITASTYYNNSLTRTKFDNNNTKFISRRDNYQNPEVGGAYIKFPKMNVIQ